MSDYKPVVFPGPWEWDGTFPIQVTDAEDHVVCEMMPSGEANACLIAAAPELLEAAKAFTGGVSEHLLGYGGVQKITVRQKQYETLLAAIAKAEGSTK